MRGAGSGRGRWIAACVMSALLLGGGAPATAVIGSGERAVFVPITPCRLFDTRPGSDNVGARTAPLGPGDTHTVQVRGAQGNCSLPSDATGVALNVAVIGGTTGSFLTVYPAHVDRPLAANLNWVGGQPPTPNKVDADVSPDGRVSFYNFDGFVHLAVDVVGYYADHHHDDRYLRLADVPPDPLQVVIGAQAFDAGFIDVNFVAGWVSPGDLPPGAVGACLFAPADLPHGAQLTRLRVRLRVADPPPLAQYGNVYLYRLPLVETEWDEVARAGTTTASTQVRLFTADLSEVVDVTQHRYFVEACLGETDRLYDVVINYVRP